MAKSEGFAEQIQAGAAALVMGYFLLLIFDALPTGNIANGPFSASYWLLSLLPYLLVLLGIVILVSMVSEVFNI
jgi:hypothetical protein